MAHLTLKEKVAIVTGASRGIGYGIAYELARRGAHVVVTYTSESSAPKVQSLVSDITALKNGSSAIPVQADMRTLSAPKAIVDATLAAFPGKGIDVLVNNAACEINRAIDETTAEDYHYVFDLNVRGPILLVAAVKPHLCRPGRIVNVASVGARKGFPKMALYGSSKAALEGLTRNWAAELGTNGTTVNCVNPGPTKTDMIDQIAKDIVDNQKKNTPVENRMASLDDIAQIVVWLCEESSRWVTGQSISASGGLEMY